MATLLQAAAIHLLCWAAFARTESTSGRLWLDIARCDGGSLTNTYTKVIDNISTSQCCYRCLAEKGCEYFLYSPQETRCLIFPPPCRQLPPGNDTGYQLFRTPAVAKCPLEKGYYYYSDSQLCLRLDHVLRRWDTALQFCKTEGGHLMIINSDAEFTNLKHYILNVQDYPDTLTFFWLGATYNTTQEVWRWNDNTPLIDGLKWTLGQPNLNPDEIYLMMKKSFEMDDDVVYNNRIVVCEMNPCLWKPSEKDYKIKRCKDKALSSIEEALGLGWTAEYPEFSTEDPASHHIPEDDSAQPSTSSGHYQPPDQHQHQTPAAIGQRHQPQSRSSKRSMATKRKASVDAGDVLKSFKEIQEASITACNDAEDKRLQQPLTAEQRREKREDKQEKMMMHFFAQLMFEVNKQYNPNNHTDESDDSDDVSTVIGCSNRALYD